MMRLHKHRQELWDQIRPAFLNGGIDPDDISSLSVTKAIRDYVQNARIRTNRARRQNRMCTYADQTERAFGCSLDDLNEDEADNIRSRDWLIDQIVCRLYGLTEDEIRVVEGWEN